MVNINLAESEYSQKEQTGKLYNTGAFVLLLVLIILLAAYFWLSFSIKNIDGKIAAANAQYAQERTKLVKSANKEVVDFQNRMDMASNLVSERNPGVESLPAIEKAFIPGVYATSLNYDQEKNSVDLAGVADTYEVLAKQILSFKQSENFSGVAVGKTGLDQSGNVVFDLSLNIK
jgi:Tfp pilus assembly protein PilN